jgi:hypothetical protein
MEDASDEIWRAGFDSGHHMLGCRCPFPYHSPQADVWEDGWTQGMLKREGLPYRNHPLSQDAKVQSRALAKLRQWRVWKLK